MLLLRTFCKKSVPFKVEYSQLHLVVILQYGINTGPALIGTLQLGLVVGIQHTTFSLLWHI